jgi:hypothetical protein
MATFFCLINLPVMIPEWRLLDGLIILGSLTLSLHPVPLRKCRQYVRFISPTATHNILSGYWQKLDQKIYLTFEMHLCVVSLMSLLGILICLTTIFALLCLPVSLMSSRNVYMVNTIFAFPFLSFRWHQTLTGEKISA